MMIQNKEDWIVLLCNLASCSVVQAQYRDEIRNARYLKSPVASYAKPLVSQPADA